MSDTTPPLSPEEIVEMETIIAQREEREKLWTAMLADDEEDARTFAFLTSVLGPHRLVEADKMSVLWSTDGRGYMISMDGGRSNNIDMFLSDKLTEEDIEKVYLILGYCRLNLIRVDTLMVGDGDTALHLHDSRLSEMTHAKEQAKEAARDAKKEAEEPGYIARRDAASKALFTRIFGEEGAQGLRDLAGQLKT